MLRDFVLYIFPFGLVRMRTFRLAHGLVRCNINAGVHTRTRRWCVIQRCQNKKSQIGIETKGTWVTSRTGSVGWDLRKAGVEFLPLNERVDIQSWARSDEFVRYGRRALVGLRADDVKAVSIERLCVSLLMSKNL